MGFFEDGQHGWLMAAGILHLLIFMILAILGVAVMAQWVMRGDRSGASQPVHKTPLMILQERYARGEIQRDEYEEKRRDLGV